MVAFFSLWALFCVVALVHAGYTGVNVFDPAGITGPALFLGWSFFVTEANGFKMWLAFTLAFCATCAILYGIGAGAGWLVGKFAGV